METWVLRVILAVVAAALSPICLAQAPLERPGALDVSLQPRLDRGLTSPLARLLGNDRPGGSSRPSPPAPTVSLHMTLQHNMPHKAVEHGGPAAYANQIGKRRLPSIAGFQAELDYLDHLSRNLPNGQEAILARRGDPLSDIHVIDQKSRRVLRRIQVYAGASMNTAAEKLFGSDYVPGNRLALPRDMHDQVRGKLKGATTIWSSKDLNQAQKLMAVRGQLKGLGLEVDDSGRVFHKGRDFGPIDGPKFQERVGALERMPHNSSQYVARTIAGTMGDSYSDLRRGLSSADKRSLTASVKRIAESRLTYLTAKLSKAEAADMALRSANRTVKRVINYGKQAGLSEAEVAKVMKTASAKPASARNSNAHLKAEIDKVAGRKAVHRAGKGVAVSAALVLGRGIKAWHASGLPVQDWLQTAAGKQWAIAAGASLGLDVGLLLATKVAPKLVGRVAPFLGLAVVAANIAMDVLLGGKSIKDALYDNVLDAGLATVGLIACFCGPAGWLVVVAIAAFQVGKVVFDSWKGAEERAELSAGRVTEQLRLLQLSESLDNPVNRWWRQMELEFARRN